MIKQDISDRKLTYQISYIQKNTHIKHLIKEDTCNFVRIEIIMYI